MKETSLRVALKSRLFTALLSGNILTGEHSGGCVPFEQRAEVEAIINRKDDANEEH